MRPARRSARWGSPWARRSARGSNGLLLKRALRAQLGRAGAGAAALARMFAAAVIAAAGAYGIGRWLASLHPLLEAAVVAAVFGGVYLTVASALGLAQARELVRALLRRARRA